MSWYPHSPSLDPNPIAALDEESSSDDDPDVKRYRKKLDWLKTGGFQHHPHMAVQMCCRFLQRIEQLSLSNDGLRRRVFDYLPVANESDRKFVESTDTGLDNLLRAADIFPDTKKDWNADKARFYW
ncbi:hypothetical protein H632_c4125p0, partial [Helicosporidium sp. ATCC 50920]